MDSFTHINPAFDHSLAEMDAVLARMEDAVGGQIADARRAFEEMSAALAQSVRRNDKTLNALAGEVEVKVVQVLARHQPVAEDLRHAIGALKMSIEYERSGDYVKHLARSIGKMSAHNEDLAVFSSLRGMLAAAEAMFAAYVQARRDGDVEAAVRVWLRDQRIDDLCSDAVREAHENQKRGDGSVYALIHAVSVAKNTERLCDKIKNLVEIFYRQKTGEEMAVEMD